MSTYHPRADWSEDRIEIMLRLWRDGHSASEIARTFGDVTRNAVIGKLHRLGAQDRGAAAAPTTQRKPKASGAQRRKLQAPVVPRKPYENAGHNFRASSKAKPACAPLIFGSKAKIARATIGANGQVYAKTASPKAIMVRGEPFAALEGSAPKPWENRVNGKECCWPIDHAEGVHSCCLPVSKAAGVSSYCDQHRALSMAPSQPQKIRETLNPDAWRRRAA